MKYTLITGASRGIGRACAIELAKERHNLILVANTDKSGLDETVSMIYEVHQNLPEISIGTYLCDVSDSEAVSGLFENFKKNGIRIDVLINNAGIAFFGLVQDMTDDEWHKVISTNLDSIFYMSRAAIPDMLHVHSGHIINISSYWGIKGAALEAAYSASKGGVNAFSLALADELEPSGIKVNAVICEFIDTDMNAHLTDEEKLEAATQMPSGRIISPEEVAKLVAKIISDDSAENETLVSIS